MAAPYSWTAGVAGQDTGANAGALNIAAVELSHALESATPSGRAYWDDFDLTSPPVPTFYCTAKVTSLGCTPSIRSTGASSATQLSGFTVYSINHPSHKTGTMLYSSTGHAATPFQAGFLCEAAAIKRAIPLSTGGTYPPTNCSGVFSLDINKYAIGDYYPLPYPNPPFANQPAAFLLVPGTAVDAQFWGRDPGYLPPNNSTLSAGIEFTIGV